MQQTQTLRVAPQRDWSYYLLLILSFFGMTDFIITSALGKVPHMATIASLWKEILIILLYLAFYMKSKAQGRINWRATRLHWMILFTFIAALLSGVFNWIIHPQTLVLVPVYHWVPVHESVSILVYGIKVLLESALYFFVLNALIDDEDTVRDMINAFLVAATCVALFGIYQKLSGVQSPKGWTYSEVESDIKLRVFSTIQNPNSMGAYMVLAAPIAVSMTLWAKNWLQRILYGASALILIYTMVETYSRGSWIGFVVGMVVYIIVTRNKWLAIILAAVIILAPFVAHNIVSRLTLAFTSEYFQKASHKGRIEFWGRALSIWKRYPIFGAGLGLVGDTVAVEHNVVGATWIDNQYMKVLAETGTLGIVTYIGMLLTPLLKGIKAVWGSKQKGTYLYALNSGVLAALVAFVCQNFTEGVFETTICSATFWMLVAILYVGIRLANQKENA